MKEAYEPLYLKLLRNYNPKDVKSKEHYLKEIEKIILKVKTK